jgi:hypothetical protein
MTDNEDNLDQYEDVLAGLERLAGGLDQQTSPLAAGQITRDCRRVAATPTLSLWSRWRPALAAAAVLIVVGLGIWRIWPAHNSSVTTISLVSNMPGKAATAPMASQPSAESEAISFTVPPISLPSLSGENSLSVPSAGQTGVQVPSLPKSESIELKFEIPSITFPTLTERGNNEM